MQVKIPDDSDHYAGNSGVYLAETGRHYRKLKYEPVHPTKHNPRPKPDERKPRYLQQNHWVKQGPREHHESERSLALALATM